MVPEEHLFYDDLRNVHLTITADLGFAPMLVRDVLELKQGSVIPLNKLAGEMTDICVNGVPLARGEVVVIADGIHIRIGEILGAITVDKESTEDDYQYPLSDSVSRLRFGMGAGGGGADRENVAGVGQG